MASKTCYICKLSKPLGEFHKNKRMSDGHHLACKKCRNKYNQELYYKSQGLSDADILLHINRASVLKKAKTKICKRCGKEKPKNQFVPRKESIDGYRYLCNSCHLVEKQKRERDMRRNNVRYRLSKNIAVRMWKSLKGAKNNKHWEFLVGYTFDELKRHLEQRFESGMTWDNYGKWHVDHIIPITSFDITSYDSIAFKTCWDLNNLRPLWEIDNKRKYNKLIQSPSA